MTEKIIPQDAFKSKKNFEEFMANHNAPEIISVLADYPKANGKAIVTIADLTQNSETIINALSEIKNLPQSPFIVWIVANERENLITAAETLNKFSNKDFGIFIFKAFLNNDKIEFKCLLKPDIKTQFYGKAKQIQLKYWERYFEICDEISVLRDGNLVMTKSTEDTDMNELITAMVGRSLENRFPEVDNTPGDVVLSVQHLSTKFEPYLKDVSFDVRKGEIFGLYGRADRLQRGFYPSTRSEPQDYRCHHLRGHRRGDRRRDG